MILEQIDEKINEKIKPIQDIENEIKNKENTIKQIDREITKISSKIKDGNIEIKRLKRQKESALTKQQNNIDKSLTISQNPFFRFLNRIFSILAQKPIEQREESENVNIEQYEEEIKRIKTEINRNNEEIKQYEEDKSSIQKEIDELKNKIKNYPSEIIQLNEREKINTQRKKPVYINDRGIKSFRELEQILGDILISTKDLDILKKDYQSYGGDYKEYYIFKACDSIETLFSAYEKVYLINTEDLPKTSQVALLVPMNAVESKDVVAFDSNRIIVSNKFLYPNGTICMVPAGYGTKTKKELKNNLKTSNIAVIEYDGNEIGDYPRCLVKLLEGNDPKKWNRDLFIKKYSYLERIKDNYFDEQAINNILQLVKRIIGHKCDKISDFFKYLKELENEGLGTETIFKQALFGEEKDIEEEVKYLLNKIQDNGYVLSEEGNKLILDLFENQIKFSKKGYEQIEENSLYNNVYRFIVSKSIDKFLKGEISKDDTYKYILMSVIATDNKALNIEKKANDYYDKKAKTNARRMEREQHEKEEEEEKEVRPKKKRKVRTPITTTKVELYYDDNYISDFNKFYEQIKEILKGFETKKELNSALRDGTVVYLNTEDDIEELEDSSIRSNAINVGNGRIIPLKKRINIQELREKKNYVPESESTAVSLLRLTHLCNRLAHQYQSIIDDFVYDYFYDEIENKSNRSKEIKKTRDFKKLVAKVRGYTQQITELENINQKKYNGNSKTIFNGNANRAKVELDNILKQMGITKENETSININFLKNLQQLFDLRNKCFESKAKLINYALKKIREEEKETGLNRGIHSYGKLSKTNTPNINQIENLIIFNLYGYGQIVFHIRDEELWKSISKSYADLNLPVIKQETMAKNIMTSPIPTDEISEELRGYIERRGKDNLIRQIARNCKTPEERRIELFKVMLVCGDPPNVINKVLRLYDSGR